MPLRAALRRAVPGNWNRRRTLPRLPTPTADLTVSVTQNYAAQDDIWQRQGHHAISLAMSQAVLVQRWANVARPSGTAVAHPHLLCRSYLWAATPHD